MAKRAMLRLFVRAAVAMVCLCPAQTLADVLHDDFNDSSTNNKWSGSTGPFTGNGGTVEINRITTDTVEGARSLDLTYNVTAGGAFSGYFSPLNDTNLFIDTPTNRAISFYVKGLAGNEVFKIEVGESSTQTQKTLIRDFINGGVTTAWREVNIPLLSYDLLNFTDPRWNGNFAIVFEEGNGAPKSGTVRIDNIRLTQNPDTYVVDSYDDADTTKSSFGGTNVFFENNAELNAQRDTMTYVGDTGASLRLQYALTNTGGGNYLVYEQTLNNGLNKGHDIRMMTSLHFWVKSDSGMRGNPVNVWLLDNGSGASQKDLENYAPRLPSDTWAPVNIPLSAFAGVDTASVKMIKWAWEYEDKSGTMWIDAVELSRGYDLTAPAIPVLSSPTADSVAQETTPAFVWNSVADAQGVSYFLQVAAYEDTDFSDPLMSVVTTATSKTFAQPLNMGGRYKWRVAAFDGHGNWSQFTDSRAFKIQDTVFENFNDSSTVNRHGGATGVFTGGSGSVSINRTAADAVEGSRSLEIAYGVPAGGDFSGYFSELNNLNLTDTRQFRSLSFFVKSLAGGEVFKVEMGESTAKTQTLNIRNYASGGIGTAWKEVNIPLMAFDQLSFTNPWWNRNLAFVFENGLGNPLSGTVRIDDIRFLANPETYAVDLYDDADTSKNAFNGTNYFTVNSSALIAAVLDSSTRDGDTGASLRMYYDVTNTGGGSYAVFEQNLTNTLNKGQDIRMMTSIRLWIKGDTGQKGPLPNVWILDMANNSSVIDLERFIPALPDTWVPIVIPLRNFPTPDTASAKMIKWGWEYEDKSGTMWIDAVELSRGYDLTPPNTPVLSSALTDSTPTFSWSGGSDAQGESYFIQVTGFADTAFTRTILSGVTGAKTISFAQTLAAGQKYQWRVAAVDGHGNWTGFSDTKSFTVFEDAGRTTVFVSDRGDSSNSGAADTDGAFGGVMEAVAFLDPSNGPDTIVVFSSIGVDSYRLSVSIAPDSGMTLMSFKEWNRRVNGQNTDSGGGPDTHVRIANSANTATILIANVDNVTVAGFILDGDSAAGAAKDGILILNSTNDSISLAHIYRMNTAVRLNGSGTCVIAASVMSQNLNGGVRFVSASRNNTIAGNDIIGNDSAGVSIDAGSDDARVDRNTIRSNAAGVHSGAEGVSVRNNTVVENRGDGIRISGGTHSRIFHNRVANNGGYGIVMQNGAQGNYAALNEIDSAFLAGIAIAAAGTNHTDTFEANSVTRCDTGALNAEGATFDLRYNWWGTRNEDAIGDTAVSIGGGGLTVMPFRLNIADTAAGADTISPDSTRIRADSSVTVSSATIRWDTVTMDRGGGALKELWGFHVFRSTSPTADWHATMIDTVRAGGTTDTRYIDTGVIGGMTYYYRVTAFDSHYTNFVLFFNESPFSDTLIVSVPPDTSVESIAIVITSPVAGDTLGLIKSISYYIVRGPINYDTVVVAQYSPDSGTTWRDLSQRDGDTQNLLADSNGETYALRWNVYAHFFDTSISGRILLRMAVTTGSETAWDTKLQLNINTRIDTGSATIFVSNRGDSSNPYIGDTDGGLPSISDALAAIDPSNGPDTIVVFSSIGVDSYRLSVSIAPDSGMTLMSFKEWNRRVNGQNTDSGGGPDTHVRIANSANTATILIANVDNVTVAGFILDGDSAAGTAKDGILILNSTNDSISLTHIYRMNTAVRLNGSGTCAISASVMSRNLNGGIRLVSSSRNNTITGNDIIGNDSAGVSIDAGSDDARVDRNTIRSNAVGVHSGAEGVSVRNNTVVENRGDGIRISGGTHSRIFHNRVANNGGYGIVMQNGAQGNYAALNEIDSAFLAGIAVLSDGANHTDTFEANNVTRCDTGALNAEGATFDLRYNWWGTRNEDAIRDTAVSVGGGSLTVMPFRLNIADTATGADTISPDSTRIRADSSVTVSSATIRWDTVTLDRGGGALKELWGFHVFRSTSPTADWHATMIDTVRAGGTTDTRYIDTAVVSGVTYFYRVTAFDSHYTNFVLFFNESPFSDTLIVSVPTTPVSSASDTYAVVLDDFNDSSTKNRWGGTTGAFTGNGGAVRINRVTADAAGDTRSLEMQFTVTASNAFSGYYSGLNDTSLFTDTANRRALSFFVKGISGNEVFKIELGESSTLNQKLTVRDHLNGGLRTSWREVNIPLLAYDGLNFKDPRWNGNFAITFEEGNGHPKSGAVRIDNIRLLRDPDTYLVDTYDDPDTSKSSFGGTNYFFGNLGGIVAAKRDDITYVGDSGASLRMYYNVSNTGGGAYSVFEQTLTNGIGLGQDIRMMTSLHLWVRGDTGQKGPPPNIWLLDMANTGAALDIEKFIPAFVADTWTPLNIPLSRFSGPDSASAKMFKWGWEYEDKSGTMWIDAVELSRGYDLTPPNTPVLSGPASGGNVALSSLTLTWTGGSDNQGESYYVQVTGAADTSFANVVQHRLVSAASTRLPPSLAVGSAYQWRVAAVDGHGNWTGFSETRAFTVVSDTNSPPTIKITTPDSISISSTTAISLTGTVGDAEDTPVKVSFLVNGGAVTDTAAVSSAGAWSATLTMAGAGGFTITARATDSNGNLASALISVTVDLAAPIVRFDPRVPADTRSSLTLTGAILDSKVITDLRITHNNDTVTVISLSADSKSFAFNLTVTLARGKNQFVAKAINSIGGIGYDTLNIFRSSEMKSAAGGSPIAFPQDTKSDTWAGIVYFADTSSTPITIPIFNSALGSYGDQWSMAIQPKDSGVILSIRRPPDTMDLKLGESFFKRGGMAFTVFEFNLFDSAGEQNLGGSADRFTSLTLALKPAAATIGGVSVADLKLFTLNEQTGTWEKIAGSGYDTAANEIRGTLTHLSFYAIFPDTTQASLSHLSDVIIYPNPFVPNDGVNENGRWAVAGDFTTGVIVDNITDDVMVRIFTISGKIVLEQRVKNAGRFQWNVTNKSGAVLASGIYIIHVEDMKGRGFAVRKVAVVK